MPRGDAAATALARDAGAAAPALAGEDNASVSAFASVDDVPAPVRAREDDPATPALAGIVVHWRNESQLEALLAAWPHDDPRFELVVVDNSASAPPFGSAGVPTVAAWPTAGMQITGTTDSVARAAGCAAATKGSASVALDTRAGTAGPRERAAGPNARTPDTTPGKRADAPDPRAKPAVPAASPAFSGLPRILRPARNLGFAGGVNAGVAATRAPLVLLLNPDAVPEPGALASLLEGFAAHPEAAGLAPRLTGHAGQPQFGWQLRRLPTAWDCLRQTLPWPGNAETAGAGAEPPAGSPVEQPAAAALALRRAALAAAGGLDERFHPAWFEDVDLARRLRQTGARLLYWPAARFRHGLGGTVPQLGYGRFLWIYYRNLDRYLKKHHGAAWALAARASLTLGLALRLPLLAVRRPRRAASRREAAAGLLAAIAGALSAWRLPRRLAAADAAAPTMGARA